MQTDYSKEKYRVLFNSSIDGIVVHILGPDGFPGRCLEANDAICRMLGYSREEMLALLPRELTSSVSVKSVEAKEEQLSAERTARVEVDVRRKDGSMIPVEIYANNIVLDGVPVVVSNIRDITERKLAEKRLVRRDQFAESIVHASPMGMHLYQRMDDGRLVFMGSNPAAEKMLGVDHSGFVGKTIEEAFPGLVATEIPGRYKDAALHGNAWRTEQIQYNEGSIRGVFEVVAFQTEPGKMVALFNDITDRKKMEESLRKSEMQYRSLIETTDTGYVIIEPSGKVVDANHEYVRLTGHRDIKDVLGHSVSEWTAAHEIEKNMGAVQQCVREGYIRNFEIDYVDPSGKVVPVELNATMMHASETPLILTLCRDITDRRKSEEREKIQLERLMQSDKLASLGTLVAGVAHEINNPNMFIMLNAPVLRDIWNDAVAVMETSRIDGEELRIGEESLEEVKKTVEQLFDNIVMGSDRIKNIVKELKDYVREDPTKLIESVDVNKVLRSAATLVWNKIKGVTDCFAADYAADLPTVRGSSQRLEQTIINLLTNACDAMSDRNKAIRIVSRKGDDGKTVVFQIIDEGAGMTPEVLARIKDPFFTTKRDSGGTGLGVAIISKIVEEHGGTMVYGSKFGKGTTVTVTLPVES